MEEEIQVPPPLPEPSVTDLLKILIGEVQGLKKENAELSTRLDELGEAKAAPGVDVTFDPNTPNVGGPQYARRVTLVTRPVADAPEDYKNCVSPNSLRNSR